MSRPKTEDIVNIIVPWNIIRRDSRQPILLKKIHAQVTQNWRERFAHCHYELLSIETTVEYKLQSTTHNLMSSIIESSFSRKA